MQSTNREVTSNAKQSKHDNGSTLVTLQPNCQTKGQPIKKKGEHKKKAIDNIPKTSPG